MALINRQYLKTLSLDQLYMLARLGDVEAQDYITNQCNTFAQQHVHLCKYEALSHEEALRELKG